jgi:ATP-dependent DNA helicase RecG
VVYPLIAESEKMDIKAAEEGYKELKERFKDFHVALLHGKTKKDDKREIMRGFMENRINLLVSTTVIEVGVNNPNASVMLIENAERFGLSQLHQLRGRVGRGSDAAWCILVYGNQSPQSEDRLMIMENTNDGFKISEEDLKQRGQGDLFGSRQHGLPDLKFLNLFSDRMLIEKTASIARKVFDDDAHLLKPANKEFRRYFLSHYADKLNYAGIG